jgi:hypothetical protein
MGVFRYPRNEMMIIVVWFSACECLICGAE